MKILYIKFLIIIYPKKFRNFNRLVRRYNIYYNRNKVKNKYILFRLCEKMSDYITNYDQLALARELTYKTYEI